MIEKIVRPINGTEKKKKKPQTITSKINCLELDFRKPELYFYFYFFCKESSFTWNSTFIKLNYKLVYFPKYFSHGTIFGKININRHNKMSVKGDLLWSIFNKK